MQITKSMQLKKTRIGLPRSSSPLSNHHNRDETRITKTGHPKRQYLSEKEKTKNKTLSPKL